MRKSDISRKTAETDIRLALTLDGTGKSDIQTGVGFLDHMLTLFARHGAFDLSLSCKGDTNVDDHHSVEDIGAKPSGRLWAKSGASAAMGTSLCRWTRP